MTQATGTHGSASPEQTATSTPEPIVRLVGLWKSFGSLAVLQGLDLDIPVGLTTVILGPSGSGKSVILKHIVGLIRPDRGDIWFRDQCVTRLREHELGPIRQQIGFLFQQSALFDSMTVRENLEFPLIEHTRMSSAQRRERITEALAMVDLEGVQSKHPAQLSGGQQKRVALARAIILKPSLILYDEPTTGLDPVRADGISELILKLRRELGVSSVVVTHDLVCARKVGDRVVMLGDGVIIFAGTMRQMEFATDERVLAFVKGHVGEGVNPNHG